MHTMCIFCVSGFSYCIHYHTVCEGEPNIWERSLATATITANVVTFLCVTHSA